MSFQLTQQQQIECTIICLLLSIIKRPLTEEEENKLVLEEIGLLHLQPVSDLAQQLTHHIDRSLSTNHYTQNASLIPLFNDPSKFYHTTRITITEFIFIHDALFDTIISNRNNHQSSSYDSQHSHPRLTPAEQLLLWMCHVVGSPTPMLELIFSHLNYSTIHRYADHITWCINTRWEHMIQWPDADERLALHGTLSLCDNAIAVLDGTHCPLNKLSYDEEKYYSAYKGYHSQNFLVAVNPFAMIIYVDGPYPGRRNDRGVYNQSELGRNPSNFVSPNELIIADGGFIGGAPLICPIHVDSIKDEPDEVKRLQMVEFNGELSASRVLVEDVFSWIKSRARVLATRFSRKKETQAAIMFAACRYYNFVRMNRIRYALI